MSPLPAAFPLRLGNEAENYGELAFGKNFYVPNLFKLDPTLRPDETPTGPIARVQVMMSITEHLTANLSEHLSPGPAPVYQLTDYAEHGGQVQWASAGVRPVVHFNRYVSHVP